MIACNNDEEQKILHAAVVIKLYTENEKQSCPTSCHVLACLKRNDYCSSETFLARDIASNTHDFSFLRTRGNLVAACIRKLSHLESLNKPFSSPVLL